ncbi:MAG TPA: iron ABC transporter permease [Crocinitomix sp.]|nr:iron ABC transporter permease [Crocinitomix sp.]
MKLKNDILILLFFSIFLVVLGVFSLRVGTVNIDFSDILKLLKGNSVDSPSFSYIIEARLNRTLMAVLGGSALAVSGLILQVFFRNPLAGPGVLGISSGVTLGVALVVLGGFTLSTFLADVSLIIFGLFGALLILFILMIVSKYIIHSVTLLIVGLMLSYFTSALVNALYHWSDLEQTRQFIVWGLGSFSAVKTEVIKFMIPFFILVYISLIFLIKPLNALVLGEHYAKSMGINVKHTKAIIIIITSVLTSVVTVYCGPIAFIGIAVPQISRQFINKSNKLTQSFQLKIPITLLLGAIFALLSDIILRGGGNTLPLNTVTSLIGAPIIIWTIIKMNRAVSH